METSTQAPPKDSSATPLATSKNGTSSLGGPKQIADRLNTFMSGRGSDADTKDKSKIPLPLPPEKDKATADKTKVDADKTAPGPKDKTDVTTDDKTKTGTDGMTKEERSQVVEFKKRAETAETRLKELETKATEGEASVKELAEIKRINKEREADYDRNEREIAAIRIQGSTKYQETIGKPMQMLTEKIEAIAKGCELDADAVFNVIGMTDVVKRNRALQEHLEKMDPLTQDTFKQAVNSLLDLEPKAQRLMKESREAWQSIQLEEKQAAEKEAQQKKETYLKASDAVWKEVAERMPTLNDPDIAKRVRAQADNFDFSTADPDILAFAAQAAYSIGDMQAALNQRDEKIEQLEASIKRMNGERVGPGDGSSGADKVAGNLNGATSGDRFNQFMSGRR